MDWKLKENIRLNKVCSTCEDGSFLFSDRSVKLCLKDKSTTVPQLAPKIKTCLSYSVKVKE